MNWLFKEEPSNYSYGTFAKDGKTVWSGVKKGDRVFYYLTGGETSVVGIAKASCDAYPDPKDRSGKAHVVDIVPAKKLKRAVTLKEIKADPFFSDFALVRMSRLSVMPVTAAQWTRIETSRRPEYLLSAFRGLSREQKRLDQLACANPL